MIDAILSVFRAETIVMLLVGLAAFATVLTIAAPFMENDALEARMKLVGAERERLRAQRAQAAEAPRLRDRQQKNLNRQIVEILKLRRLFAAETSREMLRQAGLRGERHMAAFLTARLVLPIGLAVLALTYLSALFPDMSGSTKLAIVLAAAIGGMYLPVLFVKNLIARRQQSIRRAWSDALDLMLICVESGMAIEPAMQRVAREIGAISVPLAEELTLTVAELSYLQDRRKALENLARRTGIPTVKAVVTSLIQSERYGTPLGTALRVLAQENRDGRMAEAERKAAALPPRLTVPMIVFFLPAIFVVVLGPPAISLFKLN